MSTEGDGNKQKKQQKLETFQDDIKTQESLEKELGQGVEKVPTIPTKPDIRTITLDLTGPRDVDAIVREIDKLPAAKDASAATEKYDAYQKTANKLWVIKQSHEDSFLIKMRKGIKDKAGKYVWERDKDGKILLEKKRFFYTPVTRQEKEDHLRLLEEKESANYDLIVETENINKIAKSQDTAEQEKFLERKTWITVSKIYAEKMHAYYYGLFESYYGATEEDMDRITFDDITGYVDVALYKEGVRNPQ